MPIRFVNTLSRVCKQYIHGDRKTPSQFVSHHNCGVTLYVNNGNTLRSTFSNSFPHCWCPLIEMLWVHISICYISGKKVMYQFLLPKDILAKISVNRSWEKYYELNILLLQWLRMWTMLACCDLRWQRHNTKWVIGIPIMLFCFGPEMTTMLEYSKHQLLVVLCFSFWRLK